jgi:type IV pilus assembly protein PilY1
MLHGFDASVGSNAANGGLERIAYVPLGAYSKFVNYTSPAYAHAYSVDGSPFAGDVLASAGNWRTYLAGFMGAGGKGYFVLDVTDPSQFAEASASSLVVLDATASTDPDVGNLFAQPTRAPTNPDRTVQFTMMNNDRPALILGNGINSTNERPVLLIQYLDGGKELVKLIASTTTGQSNGLSNPQVLDLNNDGKADVVYAGDLSGNMWRFDVSSATPGNWAVSFSGTPLFSAKNSTGTPQPITSAPVWLPHPRGGIQLGFGTGRNVTLGDRTDNAEQTFYAIWDKSDFIRGATTMTIGNLTTTPITGRSELVEQTMGTTAVANFGSQSFFQSDTVKRVNYGATPHPTYPNEPVSRRGWFLKFTESKERATVGPTWYADNFVAIPTMIPGTGTDSTAETCTATSTPEEGYLTVLDLINGSAPLKPIFDTNGGGVTKTDTVANKASELGKPLILKNPAGSRSSGLNLGIAGGTSKSSDGAPPTPIPLSTAWRDR